MEPTPGKTLENLASRLREALCNVVYGQHQVIDMLLVGLLAEGHILLEGIPGTAKTTLVKTLAQLTGLDFRRVQLTPDMLPSEIIGTSVYDLNTRTFHFKQGPVFTQLLLADEINRTPPKTQSALLEAMEEHQVTADGTRYELSPLFTVVATLNPIEFEGTYPLPEAQLDRFMMKLIVSYPGQEAEGQMLRNFRQHASPRKMSSSSLQPVTNGEEILSARQNLNQITLDDQVIDYILTIVGDTRQNPNLELGCSPRAALNLMAASRAYAALSGSTFVTPDHIKAVAPALIRHRLILSAEAELDGLTTDQIIRQTLNKVPVPR